MWRGRGLENAHVRFVSPNTNFAQNKFGVHTSFHFILFIVNKYICLHVYLARLDHTISENYKYSKILQYNI